MSLDGLRAWIGEVERKLGMRTRVFLVLATIAIGGAGAGIYLAIDARDSSVSESDVQALQEELEAQIGSGGATGATDLTQLEAELNALKAEVDQLQGGGGSAGQGQGGGSGSSGSGDSSGGAGGLFGFGAGGGASADGGDAGGTRARLRELYEEAKELNEQAESGD